MALVTGARVLDLPGTVHAAWSDASRGDLRPRGTAHGHTIGDASVPGPVDGTALAALAADVSGATGSAVTEVVWATQVHGSDVLTVLPSPEVPARPGAPPSPTAPPDGPGPSTGHGGQGDALVSDRPGTALCVLTADCGALALASPEGVFAAVHAGWRGLLDGVVEAAVERMRGRGATDVVGALGPCIHAGCYEFSESDLDAVTAVYGGAVRGRTSAGRPALDLPAAIALALERAGARTVAGVDACTACDEGYFSHRARGDAGRQALLVWSGRPGVGR